MKNIKGFAKMSSVLFLFLTIISIPFFTEYTEINADRQSVLKEDYQIDLESKNYYEFNFETNKIYSEFGIAASLTNSHITNIIPLINNSIFIDPPIYAIWVHFYDINNNHLGFNYNGNLTYWESRPSYLGNDLEYIPNNAYYFAIGGIGLNYDEGGNSISSTFEQFQTIKVYYDISSLDSYQVMENFRNNAVNTNYFGFITTIVTYGEIAISYVQNVVNFFSGDNFIVEYFQNNAFDIYEKWWFRPVRWLTE